MKIIRLGIIYPLVILMTITLLQKAWTLENVFPVYCLKDSGFSLRSKCAFFSTIPLFIMVFLSTANKMIYSQGIFSKANEIASQDTTENTLVFAINILASANEKFSTEQLMILTSIYIISRFLYWFGHILGAYLEIPELKLFGQCMTLVNSSMLVFINFKELVI